MRRTAAIAALSCLLMTGCSNYLGATVCGPGPAPDAGREQLVGTWRDLPSTAEVTLRNDGTMSARGLPLPGSIPAGASVPTTPTEGTWQLRPEKESDNVELVYGLASGPFRESFSISGTEEEPVLWQSEGDPANCGIRELIRK